MHEEQPRWDKWLNRDDWSVWEAANLIAGREPPTGISLDIEPRPPRPLDRVVEDIRDLANSSIRRGILKVEEHRGEGVPKIMEYYASPRRWTRWAQDKELSFPPEMLVLEEDPTASSDDGLSVVEEDQGDQGRSGTFADAIPDRPPYPWEKIKETRRAGRRLLADGSVPPEDVDFFWSEWVAYVLWYDCGKAWGRRRMAKELVKNNMHGLQQLVRRILSPDGVPVAVKQYRQDRSRNC